MFNLEPASTFTVLSNFGRQGLSDPARDEWTTNSANLHVCLNERQAVELAERFGGQVATIAFAIAALNELDEWVPADHGRARPFECLGRSFQRVFNASEGRFALYDLGAKTIVFPRAA